MRWTLPIVVVAALAIIFSLINNQEQAPSVSAPEAQALQDNSATVAESSAAKERSDAAPVRQEVSVPRSEEQAEAIISPLEALKNYALDLHTTAESAQGIKRWFDSKGALLNNKEFSANFMQRWGFSKHAHFVDAVPVGDALYSYWVVRAKDLELNIRDALLGLVWSEEHFEIWRHWVQLLAHHPEEADKQYIIAELLRYIELCDRTKPDTPARIAVILQWLGIHDSMGARQQELFFSLLSDPKIGAKLGDQYGFNLCYLVNRVSYRDIAARIPGLLTHPSKEVQWGTVELLRQYVDRGQLNGEAMVALIPDALVRNLDEARCAAALELLAGFGGQNGLEKMLGVVRDSNSPRRGAALGFLASHGRVDVPMILEFASDSAMALPVVGALHSLAKRGNEQAYSELTRCLHHEREDVRREAAMHLYHAGRLSQEQAARYGVVGQ